MNSGLNQVIQLLSRVNVLRLMRFPNRIVHILCINLVLLLSSANVDQAFASANDFVNEHRQAPILGMAFPPVKDTKERQFTIRELSTLNIRHVRIAENWKRRGVSPKPKDFAPLKRRLTELTAAGIEVLLTVQTDAPLALCRVSNSHGCVLKDSAPFEDYLNTLLDAVGEHIGAIQLGNEWDNQFAGTTDEFLELHSRFAKLIRNKKPELIIVLGGITGRAPYSYLLCEQGRSVIIPSINVNAIRQQFCVAEAEKNRQARRAVSQVFRAADYDVLDLHLYDFPSLWPESVQWAVDNSLANKTLWITEFGGPNPELEPQDDTYQSKRLASYMQVASSLNVERVYYFKLTDDKNSYHSLSGLFNLHGEKKLAYDTFKKARARFAD